MDVKVTIFMVILLQGVWANKQRHQGPQPAGLSKDCEELLHKWMQNVPVKVHPENNTLTVDWSQLDSQLLDKGCSYDQLWLELWRVNDIPADDNNFGTEDYFLKYERCNELNERHFVYHSTKTHAGSRNEEIKDLIDSKNLSQEIGTKTTFLHVVEELYVFRLCPCGRRKLQHRVCDCDYGSGKTHCSQLRRFEVSPTANVYPWCQRNEDSTAPKEEEKGKYFKIDSPGTTCTDKTTVLLAGNLYSCTPIQPYDKVKVTLFPLDIKKRMKEGGIVGIQDVQCIIGRDFGIPDAGRAIEANLVNKSDGYGEFSILASSLDDNSALCIQVELLNHPYCNSHHTVGHSFTQPVVCVNHIVKPVILPHCNNIPGVETSITSDADLLKQRVMWVVLSVVTFALAAAVVLGLYFCLRRTSHHDYTTVTKMNTPIIKNGAPSILCMMPGQTPGNTFILHFPESKNFEMATEALRDYLSGGLGCRVFDLSDPKNDERISEDPEGWVIDVLSRNDLQIIVVDSPLAGMSLALASSSTASTSLVSSSASVDLNDGNEREEVEIDVDEEKVPLSLGASCTGPPLPESAVEDNHHELRVFALRQIQSRFSGRYKQLITIRFDGVFQGGSPQSTHSQTQLTVKGKGHQRHLDNVTYTSNSAISVANTLTPHRKSLVIPQHLPELRSWLHGQTAGYFFLDPSRIEGHSHQQASSSPSKRPLQADLHPSESNTLESASLLENRLVTTIARLSSPPSPMSGKEMTLSKDVIA